MTTMQPSDKEGVIINNSISNKLNCSQLLLNEEISVGPELFREKGNDLPHELQQTKENSVEISSYHTDKVKNCELPQVSVNKIDCQLPSKKECQDIRDANATSTTKINYELLINREVKVTQVLFTLRWRVMTQILLALPVIGLFICLLTSLIFHADHINNTICDVYNFLPSISAVTGVSPQRYLWRVCVALHISPRLLVAWVAREFYSSLADRVTETNRPAYQGMVTIAFLLNLTELATLCGVTYISNKENYPVHEKLFMVFMIASLVYMVCIVRILKTVEDSLSPILLRSFSHKKWLLATKIGATIGLLFFFWRHRVHCQPKAFSWFSLCEYIIATCNMLYHVSVALDFSDEHLIVGHIVGDDNRLCVDHIVTPTAPSTSEMDPGFSMTSLPTSVSAVTQNSFNEYLNSCHVPAAGETTNADSTGQMTFRKNDLNHRILSNHENQSSPSGSGDGDVSSRSETFDVVPDGGSVGSRGIEGEVATTSKVHRGDSSYSEGFTAIKNTPPKGLDLVASSSCYSKFSGSSNSSSTSSESPCLTDSSSSENSTISSASASGSSGSFSPESATGFVQFCETGVVKQVLSTIHENPEGSSAIPSSGVPTMMERFDLPSGMQSIGSENLTPDIASESQLVSPLLQSFKDQPEFIVKERLTKPSSEEPDSKNQSEPKISKDFLSFQPSKSVPCLDKTHLE